MLPLLTLKLVFFHRPCDRSPNTHALEMKLNFRQVVQLPCWLVMRLYFLTSDTALVRYFEQEREAKSLTFV